jgi:Rieske 2Fe-2S family protein
MDDSRNQNAADSTKRLVDLCRRQRQGFSLEKTFYVSHEIFGIDCLAVFLRSWILAGHISQFQKGKGYFSYDFGNESFLITRDSNGVVRAFFNVCRHRGAVLCPSEEMGTSTTITCPYHSWVYSADGQLISARAMGDRFEAERYSLKPCSIHVMNGFIFVSPRPWTSFERVTEDIGPLFRLHKLQDTAICAHRKWTVNANWKLLIENFDECYHCAGLHPELCEVVAHAKPEALGDPESLRRLEADKLHWEATLRRDGLPVGLVDLPFEFDHWGARYPLRSGKKTFNTDDRLLAPLLGDFRSSDGGVTSFRLYPCSYLIAACDHCVMFQFSPIGPTTTEIKLSWLVKSHLTSELGIDVERLTEFWSRVVEQDNAIVSLNQRGVDSSAYEPGPYGEVEDYCDRFDRWYINKLLLWAQNAEVPISD